MSLTTREVSSLFLNTSLPTPLWLSVFSQQQQQQQQQQPQGGGGEEEEKKSGGKDAKLPEEASYHRWECEKAPLRWEGMSYAFVRCSITTAKR